MCQTNNSEKKTATKDIVCWKVLIYDGGKLFTRYQHFVVNVGESYRSRIISNGFEIKKALHAFRNLGECKAFEAYHPCLWGDAVYAKCVIPAGSTYYVGEFLLLLDPRRYKSICSNKMKIVEIVK